MGSNRRRTAGPQDDEPVSAGRVGEAARTNIRLRAEADGLVRQAEKTRVGDCRSPGGRLRVPRVSVEAGRRFVRKKSLSRLEDSVRAETRRAQGNSLARIVAGLNPLVEGGFGDFKPARPNEFASLDGFIRRRQRAILRKPEKRPEFGRRPDDRERRPNAFFAKVGLFAFHAAWLSARHCR